ncbi:MAG: sodium-dependent transporter, partial [Sphaerochaeta sp.]|nr:sodium-dependent transporter [Sphaerochaeta sp.]
MTVVFYNEQLDTMEKERNHMSVGATKTREALASRLGFILLSAGCAIGLGNVWRFPYIAGRYGGAAFVLIYVLFLFILGLPVMVMELSIGRASQTNIGRTFETLTPKKKPWHVYGKLAIIGNYVLMMFYTTITGWLLSYFVHTIKGDFTGLNADQVGGFFSNMLGKPGSMTFWMILAVILGLLPVAKGLQSGVENITKKMMIGLLLLMLVLAFNSMLLDGAGEGLKFYLVPDFSKMVESGL